MRIEWTDGEACRAARIEGEGAEIDGARVAWSELEAITQQLMRDPETQRLWGSLRLVREGAEPVEMAAARGGEGWGEAQFALLREAAWHRPDLPFRPVHDRPPSGSPRLGRAIQIGGLCLAAGFAVLVSITGISNADTRPLELGLLIGLLAVVAWFGGGLVRGPVSRIAERTVAEEIARREAKGYGLP